MTSAEIARELRAARPVAPAPLRARVLAGAALPAPVTPPSWRTRLHRPRLVILVPVAAGLVAVVAGVVALTGPSPEPQTRDAGTATLPELRAGTATGATPPTAGAGAADSAQPSAKAALGAARAEQVIASLELRVADGDALSTAVRDAVRTTRALGGYVVSSDVVSGDTGSASLTVRVPADQAQEAIAQLSELGTIVGQRVQSDDLQGELDALATQLAHVRGQLAAVRARLAHEDLTPEQRAILRARRDALEEQLRGLRAQRAATAAQAAEATIDLRLTTEQQGAVAPVPSRLDRTLDRALDVLAWEAVTALGLLLVVTPLALVLVGLGLGRRWTRRWSDDRALGAS